MRILTYNLWHGVAPRSSWRFHALEPQFRTQKRYSDQIALLQKLKPELAFFQEVNPYQERSQALTQALQLRAFSHPDAVGLKFKQKGWPWVLNSGLTTLMPLSWGGRELPAVKLSGSRWSWVSKLASLQWSESRYALLVEFLHPQWGRVLSVNTHLHHGLELDEVLDRRINELAREGTVTVAIARELRERLSMGDIRRESEIACLLNKIRQLRRDYDLILLAGDFNLTEQSQGYQRLCDFGFLDLWKSKFKDQKNLSDATYDRSHNVANHIFNQRFPLTIQTDDLSFCPKTKQSLLQLLQQQEQKPRRIDYVFAWSARDAVNVVGAELVGRPEGDEGMAPSDHFGLLFHVEKVT